MTDQGAAFAVILMDALAHRRECRRTASGELLETLLAACRGELQAEGKDVSRWHEWLARMGVDVRPRVPARYVRRTNNQVSAELESFIRDLLARGWKKSAIARALRVNRRVVIRVAREAIPRAQCDLPEVGRSNCPPSSL
jgi:hypothetical protein